jgi:tetratricopeptide (TPR) repeat protein
VRAALREVAAGAAGDDAKLAALGFLAELGDETATASFADPDRIHQKSLERFATQLDTAADVASAADLLLSRMEPEEIIEFVESFAEASPDGARRLADELCARVDLDIAARSELVRVAAPLRLTCPPPIARPLGRPAMLVGLRHGDGRIVVAVARRSPVGEGRPTARRWRFLCVLCDAAGSVADVHYRDDATLTVLREEVVRPLEAAGYERFNVTGAAARRLVGAAARRTVSSGRTLPSAYYLGRDLLGITDGHVVGGRAGEPAALLGRAVDLLAAGESARARPLLEHCVAIAPDDAEAASSLGLCLLAQGDLRGAVRYLQRAAWLEPAWPLHHWNVAAAAHRTGELPICAGALREFLARADDPSIGTLAGAVDPGHARRVSLARRFIADHARLEQATSGLGDEPRAPS